MRKLIFILVALLAVGCGKKTGPVTATPEIEAEQRREEKEAEEAESAHQKPQTPQKSPKAGGQRPK